MNTGMLRLKYRGWFGRKWDLVRSARRSQLGSLLGTGERSVSSDYDSGFSFWSSLFGLLELVVLFRLLFASLWCAFECCQECKAGGFQAKPVVQGWETKWLSLLAFLFLASVWLFIAFICFHLPPFASICLHLPLFASTAPLAHLRSLTRNDLLRFLLIV